MGEGRFDPTGLRPATVEELAAQERAAKPSPGKGQRPLLVALATCLLLVMGAGAFALARTSPNPTMVQPYGEDAPFGVGYVDGFGEHSPKPSRKPPAGKPQKPLPSPSASDGVVILMPSAEPSTGPSTGPSGAVELQRQAQTEVTAVYWTTTWNNTYDTYVWVSNESDRAIDWEVRIKLPEGATVGTAMAARKSYVDGTWVFTSTRGKLREGRVYLFAFSGKRESGRFDLRSCLVNLTTCTRFR